MIKVYTTKIIGKSVSLFAIVLSLSLFVVSCELDSNLDDERENVVGSWKCVEKDNAGVPLSFETSISINSSDSTKIWVDNFSSLGWGIKVSVGMGGRNLTIPLQTVDGNKISGSGTVASSYNEINWTYSVDDGGGKDYFTAVYTRK